MRLTFSRKTTHTSSFFFFCQTCVYVGNNFICPVYQPASPAFHKVEVEGGRCAWTSDLFANCGRGVLSLTFAKLILGSLDHVSAHVISLRLCNNKRKRLVYAFAYITQLLQSCIQNAIFKTLFSYIN